MKPTEVDLSERFADEETCAPLDPTPPDRTLGRIVEAVNAVKADTLFLVHYYQPTWIKNTLRDCGAELVISDSQALASRGYQSERKTLFCVTVPFMAGSSAILARDDQQVVIADPNAGCSLEASSPADLVDDMLDRLRSLNVDFLPVCYTNVGAAVKAVVGRYGGIICTSSNAIDAMRWVLDQQKKPVFLPDRHLADNVAKELKLGKTAYWQHTRRGGALSEAEINSADLIAWTGQCNVHVKTDPKVLLDFADTYEDGHLILHPEVPNAHISAAVKRLGPDRVGVGSTRFIRERLDELAKNQPGIAVGIATESNFVSELTDEYRGTLNVMNILRNVCACVHMRTRPESLLAALDALKNDQLQGSAYLVRLDPALQSAAKEALQRSLSLKSCSFGLLWH